MRRLMFLVLLSLISCLNVFADDLTTGRKLYDEAKFYGADNYRKALPYLQNAAKAGYGEACYLLGNMYYWGYGIEKNYAIAKTMYERSIQFGYDKGEAELGLMYEDGAGVSKNMDKAIELYEKSAARGFSIGKYFLACAWWNDTTKNNEVFQMLQSVKESEKTDPLPFKHWYRWVEYYLGLCYEYGYGVKADYKKAVDLYDYNRADSGWGAYFLPARYAAYLLRYANEDHKRPKGGPYEPMWVSRLSDCIDGDEKKYGKGVNYYRLAEYYCLDDNSNISEYLIKSADKGYGPAQRKLAECYRKGTNGVSVNYVKADELEKKAAVWFAENGDKYEEEQKMEKDAEFRNSKGVYRPGDTWKSPLGWSFKVKNVNSNGQPFGIPSDDEIKALVRQKEIAQKKKEEERLLAEENKRLDSNEHYRNSKGIYRFGDLFQDNKGSYYVVLSVDNNGRPEELMVPSCQFMSYEDYSNGGSKYVLSPSDLQAVYKRFDEINARLDKAGVPQLVNQRFITNYKTGSVIWKQSFTYSSIGDYVESKTLVGTQMKVMIKYKYSDMVASGLIG